MATNGTTNFIGDCQPDPDTKYNITSDTTGCSAAANLTALTWDVYAQQVYLNHNNVKVVVSSCAVSTSTALQVGKDYAACPAMVDLTTGIVSPEFKAWYVNPTTTQQQNYTTCQPDLAAAGGRRRHDGATSISGVVHRHDGGAGQLRELRARPQ